MRRRLRLWRKSSYAARYRGNYTRFITSIWQLDFIRSDLKSLGSLGTFRKRKPFDCGRARCRCCHWDKWNKHSRNEIRQQYLEEVQKAYGDVV